MRTLTSQADPAIFRWKSVTQSLRMIKKTLFSFLACLFVLGVLEAASRLVEARFAAQSADRPAVPGWQAEFFRTFLDWHEADPVLLWRFKAGLDNPLVRTNSRHLLGEEVTPDKPLRTYRILLLGDSSPVGLGLKNRRQAFGELLQRLLTVSLVDFDQVELVNAAVSGYTSEQIRRFLERDGWQYHPDLVIVYCGNNDASISGPLSDSALLAAQRLTSVREALSHLAFFRLLRVALLRTRVGSSADKADLAVRVTADLFGRNLDDIADQCQEHSCPLVIIKPPVPLLWPAGLQFKVFTELRGPDSRLVMPDDMARLLSRNIKYCLAPDCLRFAFGKEDVFTALVHSSAYVDSLEPGPAVALYLEQVKSDSLNPVIWNNLGVSYWQNGRSGDADKSLRRARELFAALHHRDHSLATEAAGSPFLYNIGVNLLTHQGMTSGDSAPAFRYLDSALQADYFSLRIKRDYLTEIDRLAARANVFILDLTEVFSPPQGEALFVDHCHPTAEGHQLIAETLVRLIRAKIAN
jgi:lysophospholipase L1-like esterase